MKTHRLNRLPSLLRIFTAGALASAAAAMAFVAVKTSTSISHGKTSMNAFRPLHRDVFETSLGATRSGEPDSSIQGRESEAREKIHNGRAQQAYDERAYPMKWIESAQQINAVNAATQIAGLAPLGGAWTDLGGHGVAADAFVAGESTPASVGTIYSGRATAIAISPSCAPGACVLLLGAAGGGVWKTPDALAAPPTWTQVSDAGGSGIPSNAIGSIVFDPNDGTNKTIYVGTGEPNGSSDSEAGVGLFKSTDGGITWSLVAGSTAKTAPCAQSSLVNCRVATGRSIAAIAIDPTDATHIFIGTDVARHGASSVNGGRFTPPGSAKIGLYESHDGGGSFQNVLILGQDSVNPASPNGSDFFRGGCSHIELYRKPVGATETEVYASFFDFGVFRRSNTQDHDSLFHQIFGSQGGGTVGNSSIFRTEFSLAPNGAALRVYVGDGGLGNTPEPPLTGIEAQFYEVDNANVTAATLFTGGTNGGWMKRSSGTNGTSGFGSFNYCTGQCSYDMPVFSPPGFPDIVYIGGASQYGELDNINGDIHRSNGRDVQRSEDAGVNFTDMTADATGTGGSPGVALHPDQHALATAPGMPNTLFIADDGGLWRVDGDTAGFTDMSGQCAGRSISGGDLTDCLHWLSKVPKTITSMNAGLGTLQFQSLSVNVRNPLKDIIGGTQDNGTQASAHGSNPIDPTTWFVTVFGDGGQSGINVLQPDIRMHTFFNAPGLTQIEVNHHNTLPTLASEQGWSWVGDPGSLSGENASFYIPLIADPMVDGTWFFGAEHVWRTQDNGGDQAFLEANCNEFVPGHGNLIFTGACGDWVPLGKNLSRDKSFGTDKGPGQFMAATVRAPSDTGTLWVGFRRGRVFVTSNADKPNANVVFYRIDTPTTPERFVSGIAVDPTDPNHAFISFSGYNAYAAASGTATGHVFDVHYSTMGHTATWTNIDHNLGDQPITGIAYDPLHRNLFVSTDFGVDVLPSGGSTWVQAGTGLPTVAVWGLTIDSSTGARVLYAATHGRSAWSLTLP